MFFISFVDLVLIVGFVIGTEKVPDGKQGKNAP